MGRGEGVAGGVTGFVMSELERVSKDRWLSVVVFRSVGGWSLVVGNVHIDAGSLSEKLFFSFSVHGQSYQGLSRPTGL